MDAIYVTIRPKPPTLAAEHTPTSTRPQVQTPIYTLLNPDTGSRVTLVGSVHVAEPQYYEAQNKLLAALREGGAVVYCEGVRAPSADELSAASAENRRLLGILGASMDDVRAPSLARGLVASRDVRFAHQDWEYHDISKLDAVVLLGPDGVRRSAKRARRAKRILRLLPKSLTATLMLKPHAAVEQLLRSGESREKLVTGKDLEMAVHREAVVMAAVDEQLARDPGSDFVLPWGALHIPAFRAAFAERGYKDHDEQWMTAISGVQRSVEPETATEAASCEPG